MSDLRVFTEEWEFLRAALPVVDLEKSLRETGGYQRWRAVRSADDLLRLALVYGFCGLSLRQTAAWAHVQEVAELSDVALLKRLRSCGDWLSHLLGTKLAERAQMSPRPESSLRLRLMDATSIPVPGRKGTGWRVHVGLGLGHLAIDHIEVTGAEGGETFCRFPLQSQDLVLGDRGYAHRRGLFWVRQAGGHFLVRLNWSNVPLLDEHGEPFDLFQALRQIPGNQVAELRVQTAPQESGKIPALPARLIVVRKSPAAAEKECQKILREAAPEEAQGRSAVLGSGRVHNRADVDGRGATAGGGGSGTVPVSLANRDGLQASEGAFRVGPTGGQGFSSGPQCFIRQALGSPFTGRPDRQVPVFFPLGLPSARAARPASGESNKLCSARWSTPSWAR